MLRSWVISLSQRENSPHRAVAHRNSLRPGERTTLTRELQTGGPRRRLALAQRLGRTPAQIVALVTGNDL